METEWMGRYRELIGAVVLHGNSVSRMMFARRETDGQISLNQHEWLTLEYLLEHEREVSCISRISEHLGIAQSSLSKAVKGLCTFGYVERYRTRSNRKNVILRPTEEGRAYYRAATERVKDSYFRSVFEALEPLSDEDLARVTLAIRRMTRGLERQLEPEQLIPLDDT